MFIYKTRVHVEDTDVMGTLFFAAQLRFALRAFEDFCAERGFPFDPKEVAFPIVHANADFTSPLHLGDEVEVALFLEKFSERSFTLGSKLSCMGIAKGRCTLVHVALDPKTKQARTLPGELLTLLKMLKRVELEGDLVLREEGC